MALGVLALKPLHVFRLLVVATVAVGAVTNICSASIAREISGVLPTPVAVPDWRHPATPP